jgi:hypothetical protein
MNVKDIFDDNHVVIQQGQSNCGPAALLNVLHLKGDFSHTEEELAQLCDAKVDYGTTPDNLVKAAKQLATTLALLNMTIKHCIAMTQPMGCCD